MGHLVALVAVIALADSLNPSTVGPAVYFAAGPTPVRGVGGFSAGIVAVNFAAGLLLVSGPGQALLAAAPDPGARTRRLLELCAGIGLLVAAGLLWLGRRHLARRISGSGPRLDRSSLLLGLAITTVELPTALPYFAALTVIISSGVALPTQIGLVALFDLFFVLPLLVLLVIRSLLGVRGRERLVAFRSGLEHRLAVVLPISVFLAGFVLVTLATRAMT